MPSGMLASKGRSQEKKVIAYLERDEVLRQQFCDKLLKLDPNKLVFLDECGFDHKLRREYCRAPRGKLVEGAVSGKFTKRISLIAALSNKKMIAPIRFQGCTNTSLFNQWLKTQLIPSLQKGQTVIMDNASFHKSEKTRELIENTGCNLLYLPPYSPDFNPIEKKWAQLKAIIRNKKMHDDTIEELIDYACKIVP